MLKESHEIHIRWTSTENYDAPVPYASRLPPGLHVFYTPRNEHSRCVVIRLPYVTIWPNDREGITYAPCCRKSSGTNCNASRLRYIPATVQTSDYDVLYSRFIRNRFPDRQSCQAPKDSLRVPPSNTSTHCPRYPVSLRIFEASCALERTYFALLTPLSWKG